MSAIKSISPIMAYEWLESNEAVLIDVREPAEYQEIHINGAHLIPLNTISVSQLPAECDHKKIIIHCKLGKRGSIACEKLLSENSSLDIYNVDGGIVAWEDAGLRCVKT